MCGCGVLLFFVILLFGFFLFWLFCYLGVRFCFCILIFFFFFGIFECESPFKPNYYFCYLGCCCSCLINILGGERFGCLTNGDTMEVESFFYFFYFFYNRKIVGEGGGGVQTMDIPNWSLLYWKEITQIITSKFQSIPFFYFLFSYCAF